jgi:two-component system, NarL family, captular synthesis response regulator RcsB
VLRLYAGGMSVSEVSERLNRSIKTVSTHKRKTMKKLGIHTDTSLFQYAQKCVTGTSGRSVAQRFNR